MSQTKSENRKTCLHRHGFDWKKWCDACINNAFFFGSEDEMDNLKECMDESRVWAGMAYYEEVTNTATGVKHWEINDGHGSTAAICWLEEVAQLIADALNRTD